MTSYSNNFATFKQEKKTYQNSNFGFQKHCSPVRHPGTFLGTTCAGRHVSRSSSSTSSLRADRLLQPTPGTLPPRTHAHTHTCVHTCTHARTCTHAQTRMDNAHTCTYVQTHICTHVHTRTHERTCTDTRTFFFASSLSGRRIIKCRSANSQLQIQRNHYGLAWRKRSPLVY